VHGGKQALGADAGIVDEAVDRTELVAQSFDESGDGVDIAEVEGAKRNAPLALRCCRNRRAMPSISSMTRAARN
jgi:hypothetical protein